MLVMPIVVGMFMGVYYGLVAMLVAVVAVSHRFMAVLMLMPVFGVAAHFYHSFL